MQDAIANSPTIPTGFSASNPGGITSGHGGPAPIAAPPARRRRNGTRRERVQRA